MRTNELIAWKSELIWAINSRNFQFISRRLLMDCSAYLSRKINWAFNVKFCEANRPALSRSCREKNFKVRGRIKLSDKFGSLLVSSQLEMESSNVSVFLFRDNSVINALRWCKVIKTSHAIDFCWNSEKWEQTRWKFLLVVKPSQAHESGTP